MNVGEDGRDFGTDFAETVDAGAITSESEDGVDLVFEAEDFLGFVEVDPGGAVVEEVAGWEGLRDGVVFPVEGEDVAFFEAEGLVEIVAEIDGAGSEGIHDGFLFRTVGDGDLSFDSNEKDGAVFFLPLDTAGELGEEVIDGDNLTLGEFVDGVLRDGLFGVSAFLDLPKFFACGEEEDVEAKTLHGLANVVFELLHLDVCFLLEDGELGLGVPVKVGKAVFGGKPDGNGGGDREGGENEVELPVFDFGEKHGGENERMKKC